MIARQTALVGAVLLAGLANALAPGRALAWSPLHQCGPGLYARWLPSTVPVGYSVNPAGSGLSDAEALAAVARCFDSWFEPCCSGARATAIGTTTASPTANGDGVTTVGYAASSWPADLGDPSITLAVTIPLVWSDCHISEADIVVNEHSVDFCYAGCGGRDVAFEPVVSHEIGHLFGLGHSEDPAALMYYQYSGGTDGSLREDDVNGICTIYPGDHCGCTGPEDCDPGLDCVDGACVPPDPCLEVACGPAETCVGGTCIPVGQCTVCVPCTDDGPCGANGHCTNRGDGQGRCVEFCGPAGSCPGDSVCFRATGGSEEVFVCLNPDAAEAGICRDGYACTDCAATGCAAGEQCFDGACRPDPTFVTCVATTPGDPSCPGCPGAAEGCVSIDGGARSVCTVRCVTDEDCGDCGACIDTDNPRVRVCVNRDVDEAGACPEGWTCTPPADGDGDGDADADGDADEEADGDGPAGDGGDDGGCGCRAAGSRGGGALALAAIVSFFALIRRRGSRSIS